ncbi:NUDIX hydrolase [Actinokineospora bangkokensis]|uniref:NUDIX hydrolase n=1 Tax=Actinokineospora bangkokensis TaxID=1193682 RepID=A0A1Q9LDQ5_9PSEU|nr:NUDIX domain-containing protein [Actinokineospora bangkokensis]OLR90142.1 NUDIX hydrolase [Actinokineospora bangkokensis]
MTAAHVRRIRCVGALVRDVHGKLLLVRRGREPGRGLWSVPGGKVEPGESDAEAVVREVAEETGLRVRPGRLVGSVLRDAPNGVFHIHDYACAVTGGDLRAGDDAADVRWADLAMFTTLDRSNALIEDLFDTLRQWGELPAPARRR